nr:MAG: hypothetical protein 1 [Leviviridae sp.]
MSTIRTRSFASTPVVGTGTWGGNTIYSSFIPLRKDMTDIVGNKGGVNPLTLDSVERHGGLLTGQNPLKFIANGMPVSFSNPSFITGVPNITNANYGNRVLSQSGPLTPRMYLPVSLFELRDIPKMLKHAGDLLLKIGGRSGLDPVKEAAAATLAYQFGWAPLLEDIGKMLDFTETMRKRQQMLLRAHTSKGVRRKVTLDSDKQTHSNWEWVWSTYGVLASQRFTEIKTYKRWATISWTVKDKSQIGRIPTFSDEMRTAYGLNRGHIPIAVWKAMPWSWAIDWFADISNVMQANYNMIYYQPSRCCIMTHFKTERNYDPWFAKSGMFSITPGQIIRERKSRQPFTPTAGVTLKLPFMDSFKLSIVGSMSILALSRR